MIKSSPYGRKSYSLRRSGSFSCVGTVCRTSALNGSSWEGLDSCNGVRRDSNCRRVNIRNLNHIVLSSAGGDVPDVAVRGIFDVGWVSLLAESPASSPDPVLFSSAKSCFAVSASRRRSKSALNRSTLLCSHCEILKGSKKLPAEKSHQQRSTTCMTEGKGRSL